MNKRKFLKKLKKALYGLPSEEINGRIAFYSELIDDKIEDGMTEEAAVLDVGDVGSIVERSVEEYLAEHSEPRTKLPASRSKGAWALIIIGAPLWFVLIVAFAAVILSVAVSVLAAVWSVVISLWATVASLCGCFIGGVVAGVVAALMQKTLAGVVVVCGGTVCLGLSIILCILTKKLTVCAAIFTKWLLMGIKNMIVRGMVI